MSKDKIEVNMNVYDIPIVVEALEEANKEIERLDNIINELKKENEQLKKELHALEISEEQWLEETLGSDE